MYPDRGLRARDVNTIGRHLAGGCPFRAVSPNIGIIASHKQSFTSVDSAGSCLQEPNPMSALAGVKRLEHDCSDV